VTSYEVEGPEFENRQGQIFPFLHTSLSSAKVKKEQSYNSAPRVCLYGLDWGKVTFFFLFFAPLMISSPKRLLFFLFFFFFRR